MNRPLIASILVLAAAVTHAEARSPIGGATMPREQVAPPIGERASACETAAARTRMEAMRGRFI